MHIDLKVFISIGITNQDNFKPEEDFSSMITCSVAYETTPSIYGAWFFNIARTVSATWSGSSPHISL